MTVSLGLDIGSNSVGSAWVDTAKREIHLGVSVFPAGVDEQENKRGAPKNQARRQKRSQRRNLARRAARKRLLRKLLSDVGLLPADAAELQGLFDANRWPLNADENVKDYTVWHLRRDGLRRELHPYEFGRILIHLNQRRGAIGIETDPDDPEEGKVKEGIDRLDREMQARKAETVGQLFADLMDERRQKSKESGKSWREPIRNRQYRMNEKDQLYAPRGRIQEEFRRLWARQKSLGGKLASLLTDELARKLDSPLKDDIWRHKGVLFGQRQTYWDTGTLGRCALEPTERCVPLADMHAQHFRVIETVNNVRITLPGEASRSLKPEEREHLIQYLRGAAVAPLNPLGLPVKPKAKAAPKDVKPKHVQEVLGMNPKLLGKHGYAENAYKVQFVEADPERIVNTDWFYREIVHSAFGEERWTGMEERAKESVNRAILKFDPDEPDDAVKLRNGAPSWWHLDEAAADRVVAAWKTRPKLEKRLNLSRRAILNLLPYMQRFDEKNGRWPTEQEARKAYASLLRERFERTGEYVDELAARRYATGAIGLTADDRRFMRLEKHCLKDEQGQVIRDGDGNPIPEPPPAPMISNPVVRKAIHEVRRHLLAWMRNFRRKPDRVVIEFARGVKDTAKRRNEQLAANREREKERKLIEENLSEWRIPQSNWERAILRVRLCREQNGVCPFSLDGPNASRTITEKMAAEGREVEIEHIVPEGLAGKTMAFNNLVLCYREANRGKGMRTPADWLGAEGVKAMLQRLENAPIRRNRFKWERLQAPTPDEEGFRSAQLTDTAYAARQVAGYIADALYDGQGLPERGGERRIFTTKGEYTARLRADWGLHESTIDRAHGLENAPSPDQLSADPHLEQASRRARKEPKDRSDHRHHAIDALVIATVGPELLTELGRMAREDREYRERTGFWPRRRPFAPPKPWDTVEAFHEDVIAAFDRLLISHRPVKRRLVGAFHEETAYGPVTIPVPLHRREDPSTLFTNRIPVYESPQKCLSPNHLRVPEGWDDLSARLEDPKLPEREEREVRRKLAAMPDPSPGKSGIVRDRELRDRIRKCLRAGGIDPDNFSKDELKRFWVEGRLTMKSGVPIKSVILLRTNTDPIVIRRKRWDPVSGRMIPEMDPRDPEKPHPRTQRVYIGGNNHHMEIRADSKGRWTGTVISAFDVAKRLRPAKGPDGSSAEPQPAVNRANNLDGEFIMSLAEGETIYGRRKDRPDELPAYFIVCKLDKPARIHFAPHWDARKAGEQDRWDATPGDLRHCGPEPGTPPMKVRVSPLGEVTILEKD